jgi:glycosyltransferase involved in cell wall biosynthesis
MTPASRASAAALRILVVAPLPKADEAAGDRRLVALLEMLAKRGRVDFLPFDGGDVPQMSDRHVSLLTSIGINVLPPGRASFKRAMSSTCYHFGLFEFFWTAEALGAQFRRRQPAARVVVDSVDVHYLRELCGTRVGVLDRRLADDTRRRELAAYRSADGVIVVTEPEADALRREGGMGSLFVIPIIVAPRPRRVGSRRPGLLFIGGFKHAPNLDGLLWFVNESWSSIRRRLPDATLTVIGSHAPPEVGALNGTRGINIMGYVPDTLPFLDEAAISIAPLRYGSGMKGKVIEALACGVPVVTTSVGIQGVRADPRWHVRVADDPTDFADAVCELLRDPERAGAMGIAGQRLAAELCGPERVSQLVFEMLHVLVPNPGALRFRLAWYGSFAVHPLNTLRRKAWKRMHRILSGRPGEASEAVPS